MERAFWIKVQKKLFASNVYNRNTLLSHPGTCSYTYHLDDVHDVQQLPQCESDGTFAAKQCRGDKLLGRFVKLGQFSRSKILSKFSTRISKKFREFRKNILLEMAPRSGHMFEPGLEDISWHLLRTFFGYSQMFLLQWKGTTNIRMGLAHQLRQHDMR